MISEMLACATVSQPPSDAGKSCDHFADELMEAAEQAAKTIQATHPEMPAAPVAAVTK